MHPYTFLDHDYLLATNYFAIQLYFLTECLNFQSSAVSFHESQNLIRVTCDGAPTEFYTIQLLIFPPRGYVFILLLNDYLLFSITHLFYRFACQQSGHPYTLKILSLLCISFRGLKLSSYFVVNNNLSHLLFSLM